MFKSVDLSSQHIVQPSCSLWYLRDDDNILPWVLKLVEEGNWCKGKLYCPQCEARIGAFDFIHMIECECRQETIPAIYVVKSKIDHMKAMTCGNNDSVDVKNTEGNDQNDSHGSDNQVGNSNSKEQNGNLDSKAQNGNTSSEKQTDNPEDGEQNGDRSFREENDISGKRNSPSLSGIDDTNIEISRTCSAKYNPASLNIEVDGKALNGSLNTGNESISTGIELDTLGNNSEESEHCNTCRVGAHNEKQSGDSMKCCVRRRFNSTTSIFENVCFDSEVSDGEDVIVDAKCSRGQNRLPNSPTECANEFPRDYFTSHKATPHVLNCTCCRSWYNQLLSRSDNRRRVNPQCGCSYLSRQRFDDFVNISYDASSACLNCQQNSRLVCGDLDALFGVRGDHDIHGDLVDVQRELRNLQDLIESDENVCSTLKRRRTRHRRRAAQESDSQRRRSNLNYTTSSSPFQSGEFENNQEEELERSDDDDDGTAFEIPDRYQCPVCLDILYDPHTTACRHVFCGPCLRQLHKVSRKKPMCPLCRQRIYSVEASSETQDEIKRLYPDIHRQRSLAEMRRPANNHPLPSPSNVRFQGDVDGRQNRLVHFCYVIRTFLIILFMLLTYLLNGDERHEHRRYARHVRLFFYGVIALLLICCGIGVGIVFTFYAYDFVRFLIGFCLFYVVVIKFFVTYITAP